MVERQEVEQVGAGERLVVLRVVGLVAEHRGEFAEVGLQPVGPDGEHIRAVALPDVAIDARTRLVRGAALDRFRRLPELQVDTQAVAAPGLDVRCGVHHEGHLLDAECVGARIVRSKHEAPVRRAVPVVLIVALQRRAELDVAPGVGRRLSAGERRRKDDRGGQRAAYGGGAPSPARNHEQVPLHIDDGCRDTPSSVGRSWSADTSGCASSQRHHPTAKATVSAKATYADATVMTQTNVAKATTTPMTAMRSVTSGAVAGAALDIRSMNAAVWRSMSSG